ncbi:hypothetical protein [Vibrio splendidus]|uniref:hypothetical protein n=1 Tax=Vibrio splendidus TaxID=29497 RepID=UPI000066FCC0|nr:hypothetical protein [Vibrio splendidus]EAP95692.1 putative lipoprotein [Vibrio splendidus 12B01]OCH63251.1 hypothetical protein A6D94_15680 [Vibrio splendidus]
MKKLVIISPLLLAACTSSVHMSQVSQNPNIQGTYIRTIEVATEKSVVMGFAFDTDYVDQAYTQILERCPMGASLVNIEYLTDHGFLHWTNKIRVRAACNK